MLVNIYEDERWPDLSYTDAEDSEARFDIDIPRDVLKRIDNALEEYDECQEILAECEKIAFEAWEKKRHEERELEFIKYQLEKDGPVISARKNDETRI